jgi:hypothetical protein
MSTSFIITIFLLVYVMFLLYKSVHIVGFNDKGPRISVCVINRR